MIVNGQDPATQHDAIRAAAHALQRGELLGLPTETVYGLAADAGNEAAVAQIFVSKGRPANHPLIVHVADAHSVTRFASHVPPFAKKLMDAFWPGPLTLILPRRPEVAAVAAGGQDSVGLRCPSHPLAQAVLHSAQALGVWGVAAPSANLFGRVSPTTAAHVASEFGDALLVVDGGACAVGIESTIVDCTRAAPVLLRPGVLTPAQLSAACGVDVALSPSLAETLGPASAEGLHRELAVPSAQGSNAANHNAAHHNVVAATHSAEPRASGTLASHYAPSATLRLVSEPALQQALDAWASQRTTSGDTPVLGIWATHAPRLPLALQTQVHWQAMPTQAQACAQQLFAQLRTFDTLGVAEIWVQTPPTSPDWAGVRDRLTRAAAPTG